ncbi:e7473f1a-0009-47fe-8631-45d088f3e149-CDS [Sclerotinia trifoliorum]|uniref:E7473f1a-0009-47fe-8631-45d088f3e149-CDS n=1 Tax=Sclerotinia trifoliorum TaxID=28548 RepID=A0A8H2ZR25_9HELO|nr:e7473f1a-0009-47fe-8631-45d088f3e149-CDS [Sclerotinia trifoliorum]
MARPPVYEHFKGSTEEELNLHRPKSPDFILCQVCGLTSSLHEHNSYFSHVKVSMNACRGMWSIGDKYFLKERPKVTSGLRSPPNADYAITKLLAEKSNVPVAKDMRTWEDKNSDWYWMERCPGVTLLEAEDSGSLTFEQHRTIGYELAEYLAEARKFTSTKPEAPDGSRIRDRLLGADIDCVDLMTVDQEEWWARTEPRLRQHPLITNEWKKKFKESYPFKEGDKYVLSHGDLDASNIMVKDGHVTAIIDWEHGGYRPEWFEWAKIKGRPSVVKWLEDHPGRGRWVQFLAARMVELGMNVEIPDEVYECIDSYRFYVKEPGDENLRVYQSEAADRYWYQKCTNYTRYLLEGETSAATLAHRRKIREKEEAEQTAVMLAFNKLSLNEKDIFLTGKSQLGSGQSKRDLNDSFDDSRYYS